MRIDKAVSTELRSEIFFAIGLDRREMLETQTLICPSGKSVEAKLSKLGFRAPVRNDEGVCHSYPSPLWGGSARSAGVGVFKAPKMVSITALKFRSNPNSRIAEHKIPAT